jgi:hypothetical protein
LSRIALAVLDATTGAASVADVAISCDSLNGYADDGCFLKWNYRICAGCVLAVIIKYCYNVVVN